MTGNVSVILVLTIMSGCSAQSFVEEGESDMRLEDYRYSVILDRLRELTDVQSSESKQAESISPRAWATGLRETVWQYNLESARRGAKGGLPMSSE